MIEEEHSEDFVMSDLHTEPPSTGLEISAIHRTRRPMTSNSMVYHPEVKEGTLDRSKIDKREKIGDYQVDAIDDTHNDDHF
ncbi:uncharacterized protein PHALS_00562 [Plasmopara halstedii]|uniref:Uncharacterized protein n=1 Tax=Plasmopara halstedii TaxID=4781 RepID=A0A0N7L6H3_PLAHL|nr:uncharacterized protein PHALS_00562 [Plasmopara halstedii]CEG44275.1 hypothetical protein PHALS_00562 [Plasmopara halstedii]|eukprot:XP_024580644.1 hypothetical protein PHALS_00562 [Plasmopara halstedii]